MGNTRRAGEVLVSPQCLKMQGLGKAPPWPNLEQWFAGVSGGVLSFSRVICDGLLKKGPKEDCFKPTAKNSSWHMGLSLKTFPRTEKSFGFHVCISVFSLFFLRQTVPKFLIS